MDGEQSDRVILAENQQKIASVDKSAKVSLTRVIGLRKQAGEVEVIPPIWVWDYKVMPFVQLHSMWPHNHQVITEYI